MKNKFNVESIKAFIISNVVPILFIVVSIFGIYFSGVSLPIIFRDVISRFDRNAFLVLSLIVPVLAGMGLNFGIVLGAMSGQAALFIVTIAGIPGVWGLLAAVVIALPIAIFFGWLTGLLLNKTKGQEMITSLVLGFFAMGIYQFIFLFAMGGIFPVEAKGIMLSTGIGLRSTIDLKLVKEGFDKILVLNVFQFIILSGGITGGIALFKSIVKKQGFKKNIVALVIGAILIAFGAIVEITVAFPSWRLLMPIPTITYGIIFGLCIFMTFFFKTKIGQDMRAVGQNMEIAEVAGINVNKMRIMATIMSIVLAAWGQIIFLQNMGNISTYNAHENVGMFSAAALLIGGASVVKATVPQAIMGTVLFHLLFNVSPMAGQRLFGSPEYGEYFRVFIAYGIIAVTLALYAWKQGIEARNKSRLSGGE